MCGPGAKAPTPHKTPKKPLSAAKAEEKAALQKTPASTDKARLPTDNSVLNHAMAKQYNKSRISLHVMRCTGWMGGRAGEAKQPGSGGG